jgi:hypothetical protein
VDGWDEVRWATTQAGYESVELIRRSNERLLPPEVVLEGIHRAAAIWAQLDDEDMPPFTTFAIPPGTIDLRGLDQSELWVDIFAMPHRIRDRTDFTDGYLRNVIAFLVDESPRLARDYGEAFPERWRTGSAREWIEGTPLMVALRAEQALREHSNPLRATPETGGAS